MTVPVFEEYEPALDCPCAGCAEQRRDPARGLSARTGGRAAHSARQALVLVTAAGIVLGGTGAGAAQAAGPGHAPALGRADDSTADGTTAAGRPAAEPDPSTPQGDSGPLHGPPTSGPGAGLPGALRKSTRAEIINRAKRWVSAKVPYSMNKFWSDGYRQDCSGFVSMAWNLTGNEWTGSLAKFGVKIARADLEPGDMLLFHNPADPSKGSHVTIFGGWTDYTHSTYMAYEQTTPYARVQPTPMAYWSNSDRYVPYRYKGLTEGTAGAASSTKGTPFPGAKSFGPGADNKYVTQLGTMLIDRGAKRFYRTGPGPRWSTADRNATKAFQLAQGWRGAEADGLPGIDTWRYLVDHLGKDIAPAGAGGSPGKSAAGGTGTSAGGKAGPGRPAGTGGTKAPVFPGARYFRPGQSNKYVEQLGKQLVKKGFGKYYVAGPTQRWGEADRRNVQAFQRAQGWGGGSADGYPGAETWRRLFA